MTFGLIGTGWAGGARDQFHRGRQLPELAHRGDGERDHHGAGADRATASSAGSAPWGTCRAAARQRAGAPDHQTRRSPVTRAQQEPCGEGDWMCNWFDSGLGHSNSPYSPVSGRAGTLPEHGLLPAPGDRRSEPSLPSWQGFAAGLACFYGDGLGSLCDACLHGCGGRVPGEGDLVLAQVGDHLARVPLENRIRLGDLRVFGM